MPSRKISVFAHHHSSFVASPVSAKGGHSSSHLHTRLFGFKLGFGVGAGVSIFFFLLFLLLRMLKQKWRQNRASADEYLLRNSAKLRSFTYSELKTATQSFDNAHKLGQGGFGAVHKGILKGGEEVAVKKLDVASFQGEREFQNELSVIGHVCVSPHIVRLVGFCSNGKKRLLVYEYMHNRSLQEALFDEDYPAQLYWARRFHIIVDTCKALAFLHACEPPIIHGDIKPSNVLLDVKFCAKIADFGLARFKTGSKTEYGEDAEKEAYVARCTPRRQRRYAGKERKQKRDASVTCATMDIEKSTPQQQVEPLSTECYVRQSVSSVFTTSPDSDASSSITEKTTAEKTTELSVKDYVMDWMGYDSRKDASGSSIEMCADGTSGGPRKRQGVERREHSHQNLDLWGAGSSQEEGGGRSISDTGDRKGGESAIGRDAWHQQKEEDNSISVVSAKKATPKGSSTRTCLKSANLEWWRDDTTEDNSSAKTKKRAYKERPRSREWWRDEEICNSKEWKASKKKRERSLSRETWSGEICSRGVSSTPSMRGTICYVAPEHGSNGAVSEKCDVYSLGVLLLVIISGRRPLQVMASPITEFERANLISWARHLAHSGSVLELVDPSLQGEFCRKQATLSITVALLCLQRLPSKRPSMNEVLKMLLGEMEAPSLPFPFSPSPPCRVPYRVRRCSLSSEGVTADFSVSS